MGIITSLRNQLFPERQLIKAFVEHEYAPPCDIIFTRSEGTEDDAIWRLCDALYKPKDPNRDFFKDPILKMKIEGVRRIDLQNVYGVNASKCVVLDFDLMAQTTSIRDMIAEHNSDPAALIEHINRENVGALPTPVRPVSIHHQLWNNKSWIGNGGSSHKLASLWLLDRQAERQRWIECEVTEYQFLAPLLDTEIERAGISNPAKKYEVI